MHGEGYLIYDLVREIYRQGMLCHFFGPKYLWLFTDDISTRLMLDIRDSLVIQEEMKKCQGHILTVMPKVSTGTHYQQVNQLAYEMDFKNFQAANPQNSSDFDYLLSSENFSNHHLEFVSHDLTLYEQRYIDHACTKV